jgi:uncharacterized protein (DUF305 family)
VTATEQPPAPADDAREPRWVRPFLVAGAVIALLLVGVTGGLMLGRAGAPTTPAQDSVDVEFLQDMSVHHQQAVTMAGLERDRAADPQLRQLAFDIETTQNAQVGRMQGWLEVWGAASAPVNRNYMTWMTPDGASHGSMAMSPDGAVTMPGMASQEELKNLRAATGKPLDVLFLQLMLRHHEGGACGTSRRRCWGRSSRRRTT